jgi:hypothetical protein
MKVVSEAHSQGIHKFYAEGRRIIHLGFCTRRARRFAFDPLYFAQDDWRAMREAALKEQAAGTDSADTPMVDEDVKPCIGELQVLDSIPPLACIRCACSARFCCACSASPEVRDTPQVPVEADGSLNFFWIDAYEDINKPGRIYLFGKIRNGEAQGKPAYTSCCLQVCFAPCGWAAANRVGSICVRRGERWLHG